MQQLRLRLFGRKVKAHTWRTLDERDAARAEKVLQVITEYPGHQGLELVNMGLITKDDTIALQQLELRHLIQYDPHEGWFRTHVD